MTRDHTPHRPMPVEESILWKPLHDPHYVVASLQPADGGRRKIFVRQRVLGHVGALVRAHGRRAAGLLLGQLYTCSRSGAEYIVVESSTELKHVGDEADLLDHVKGALAEQATEHHGHFLGFADHAAHAIGWYHGVPTVEAKPPGAVAAIHKTLLARPWQTTLLVGEGADGSSGAFFLYDVVNSRWFYAPFYELPDHAAPANAAKPTVINWREYMTADTVVFTRVEPAHRGEDRDDSHPRMGVRRFLGSRALGDGTSGARHQAHADESEGPTLATPSPAASLAAHAPPNRESVQPLPAEAAPLADRPLAPVDGAAAASTIGHDRVTKHRSHDRRAVEKLAIVDDRAQRSVPLDGRPIDDAEDTAPGGDPARYIQLARAEGFFVAAQFPAVPEATRAETLWVLNEPYSGLLLTVVTTASEVVDATLHYNLQTDDAGLQRIPFPEHRDPETKTVYMREPCVDALRARCRRLRATNALRREWTVAPTLSLLTPAEWESVSGWEVATGSDIARVIRDLDAARLAEIPPGLRDQFHLTIPGAGA